MKIIVYLVLACACIGASGCKAKAVTPARIIQESNPQAAGYDNSDKS